MPTENVAEPILRMYTDRSRVPHLNLALYLSPAPHPRTRDQSARSR